MSASYEQRAAAAQADRDAAAGRSAVIARLRLAAFLPGAISVFWALTHQGEGWWLAIGVALLGAFAVLVVLHARVEERVAWCEALHAVNMQARARLARAWDRLPPAEAPDAAVLDDHPYASDLDLFGRASLMQWIGPAATASGTATLHAWLLQPAEPEVVVERQRAIAALVAAEDWRQAFAAHGRLAQGLRSAELAHFIAWAEGPSAFSRSSMRLLRLGVPAIALAIWVLAALHATGMTATALWSVPLVIGIVLSFVASARIHREFNRAGAGQHALTRYAALFAHAVDAPAGAPALASIRARLSSPETGAPQSMRALNSILGFSNLRSGAAILHFPIQAFTLWDFHVFFALDRWRIRAGRHVRGWMDAVGELDALSAFARIAHDYPSWCIPHVQAGDPAAAVLTARALGHPLIPDDRRVANDVTVGPPGTLLLITGSNMSGKSTLLRAVGLNTVLAQAGAPACAASLQLPSLDLETSIRVQDSLEQGLSYFMAALARLKRIVERSEHPRGGRVVLFLLDEILQGTNTAERGVAVRGIARHLLDAGAIGVMTTHDLALAAEEPLASAARLVHFTETVDADGTMSFDYRLHPGIATSRNALRLMRLIGIAVEDEMLPPTG